MKKPSKSKHLQAKSKQRAKFSNKKFKTNSKICKQVQLNNGTKNEIEIQPAIKSMQFRKKRGTRMKDLMAGKIKTDKFWQKNMSIFGGNLTNKEDTQESDYEPSSEGEDSFDSDFDETNLKFPEKSKKISKKNKFEFKQLRTSNKNHGRTKNWPVLKTVKIQKYTPPLKQKSKIVMKRKKPSK